EKVRVEVTDLRTDRNAPLFLNSVRFPLTIPVWQVATYVSEVGFSLPPYLQPRVKDNALAWHLARHGDLEAARKIAGPGQEEKLVQLHRSLYDRNYPVEWTRLVGRVVEYEQLRLLRLGEGVGVLGSVHRQLGQVLDAKARQAPLGVALLP